MESMGDGHPGRHLRVFLCESPTVPLFVLLFTLGWYQELMSFEDLPA